MKQETKVKSFKGKENIMARKTIKNKDYIWVITQMYKLQEQGWQLISGPKKNFFGKWICKLKK